MGVPVILRKRSTVQSGYGAPVLAQAGRATWVCDDDQSFFKAIESVSADLDGLAALRQSLRAEIADSALHNMHQFALSFLTTLYGVFLNFVVPKEAPGDKV